jgi:acetyl esterase/lipase
MSPVRERLAPDHSLALPGVAMNRLALIALSFALLPQPASAQQPKKGQAKLTTAAIKSGELVYKTTPQGELKLHVYYPDGWQATDRRPVIVFFFGGAWRNGSFIQFVPQSEYFASRGLVAISADYRIESKHRTTPDVAVEDARSAIRFVRARAGQLGIDPQKVIAGGGSAGGHLAACTALLNGFDAASDPKESCKPNALVLFNPALNLTLLKARSIPGADGQDIAKLISPTLYLTKSAPPTVIFFGTGDAMLAMGKEYAAKAKDLGVRAELYTAADQPHGFFNRSPWNEATTAEAGRFLASLGYLTGEPTVKPKGKARLKKE